MVGTLMVTAQLSTNVLVPRIGPKVVVPVGLLLAAIGMAWLTRLGLHSTYAAHVLPPLLVIGLGLGLSRPLVQADAAMRSYSTAFSWAAGFFTVGAVVAALLFRGKGAVETAVRSPSTA
jgi:fucose permease